jgi:hypothetical protein
LIDFKLLQTTVTKNGMALVQNRHEDQRSRTEDLEISPHSYSHLLLKKVAKTRTLEQTAFPTNGVEKAGCPRVED